MPGWLLLVGVLHLPTATPSASLDGVVRDRVTGAPVAGAVVSLPDSRQYALSDSLGYYRFLRVAAGERQVSARRIGYGTWTVSVLVPDSGGVTVDFSLRPQPVPLLTLEARADSGALDLATVGSTPASFITRRVDAARVGLEPLLAEPDYLAAMAGGEVVVAPENPDGLHVGGSGSDQVGVLLDGFPLLNSYHAGGAWQGWNPDITASAELSPLSDAGPGTLGGALSVQSIGPGARPEARGALSATQSRMAFRTPLGSSGAGAVFAIRRGFPGLLRHSSEASHFGGGNGDGFARLQAPLFGGLLVAVGYDGSDRLTAATAAGSGASDDVAERHSFRWDSRTLGLRWTGAVGDRLLTVSTWHAATDAAVRWGPDSLAERLWSTRSDAGLALELRGLGETRATELRLELGRGASGYQSAAATRTWSPQDEVLRAQLRLAHRRTIARGVEGRLGAGASVVAGHWLLDPSIALSWRPAAPLTLTLGYLHQHQSNQSLRNPELVTGVLLPVDLAVSGAAVAPGPARADLVSLGVEFLPARGVRLGARGYARRARNLALVAAGTSGPFAIGPVPTGQSRTVGLAFDVESRWGFGLARVSYGYQRTRHIAAGVEYQPAAAVPHTLLAGITVLPVRRVALRAGFTGQFGRRATAITGPFEWESCNLQDQGCEFAGTPALTGPLGALSLPAYLRLDLGARVELHSPLFGRDAEVAVYGTVTNLLARRNYLTTAVDSDGTRIAIELRPRAPLVVGLDWRF